MIDGNVQCGICGKMGAHPETEICDSVECAEKLQELWETAYDPVGFVGNQPEPPPEWWQSKEDCSICGGGGCLSCKPSMYL